MGPTRLQTHDAVGDLTSGNLNADRTVWDQHDFGLLDYDGEDGTEHAQGRWFSPDPYSGSYDMSNPQSFNRYAYVLNDPVSLRDPSGLDCAYSNDDGTVKVSAGDCDETIADGNGYYVDCDGCLLNASANLDLTTGTLTFTSADGTLYTIDDYADPLGTSTTVNVNGSTGVNYALGYGISGIQVTGLIAPSNPAPPATFMGKLRAGLQEAGTCTKMEVVGGLGVVGCGGLILF